MNMLRTREKYHLFDVDESTMMTLVVGIKKVIDGYKSDLLDEKFVDDEDQTFLRTEIRSLEAFVRETERYFTITENGFEIHR